MFGSRFSVLAYAAWLPGSSHFLEHGCAPLPVHWYPLHWPREDDRLSQPRLVLIQQETGLKLRTLGSQSSQSNHQANTRLFVSGCGDEWYKYIVWFLGHSINCIRFLHRLIKGGVCSCYPPPPLLACIKGNWYKLDTFHPRIFFFACFHEWFASRNTIIMLITLK